MEKPMLDIQNISYTYHTLSGETLALQDINFKVVPGEFISIVGPSGCGKSTLLNILAGLIDKYNGQIKLCGEPLDFSKNLIGYMLQKDHLLEWRTIYINITLGLEIQRKVNESSLKYIDNMLHAYGLYDFNMLWKEVEYEQEN